MNLPSLSPPRNRHLLRVANTPSPAVLSQKSPRSLSPFDCRLKKKSWTFSNKICSCHESIHGYPWKVVVFQQVTHSSRFRKPPISPSPAHILSSEEIQDLLRTPLRNPAAFCGCLILFSQMRLLIGKLPYAISNPVPAHPTDVCLSGEALQNFIAVNPIRHRRDP